MLPPMSPTEATTRTELINPQLERAKWNLSDHSPIAFEVPVTGKDTKPWKGVADFCLYDTDGTVPAVIEAKKTTRDAREAKPNSKSTSRQSPRSSPSFPLAS